jgi:vacuolar-type H+-ATPase subunit E/Vma4
MPLYDQVELLCQAISTQAGDEAEKIRARAREEADRRLSDAEARYQEVLAQTRVEVEGQARLDARSSIDRAALESKRKVFEIKETWLNEIFFQAQDRLQAFRQTPDYRDWLLRSLAGALQQLEGDQFQVMANPAEEPWLIPEPIQTVSQEHACQLTFTADPDLPPGGFVVVRADGRVRFDQTFKGIIDRGREALRAEIARKLWGR